MDLLKHLETLYKLSDKTMDLQKTLDALKEELIAYIKVIEVDVERLKMNPSFEKGVRKLEPNFMPKEKGEKPPTLKEFLGFKER